MQTLSRRILEFSVPELFNGNVQEAKNRLALDYVIPARLATNEKYDLKLVANLRHIKNEQYYTQMFWVKMSYCSDDILTGPLGWDAFIDSLAYQLISALGLTVQSLSRPTYITLHTGDISGLAANMKRIWIA